MFEWVAIILCIF